MNLLRQTTGPMQTIALMRTIVPMRTRGQVNRSFLDQTVVDRPPRRYCLYYNDECRCQYGWPPNCPYNIDYPENPWDIDPLKRKKGYYLATL